MKQSILFRAIGALLLTIGSNVTVRPAAASLSQVNTQCAALEKFLNDTSVDQVAKRWIAMAFAMCITSSSVDGWNGVDEEAPTADVVKMINEGWSADKATCHSNPNALMKALGEMSKKYASESWDGSTDYTVDDPGTAGAGIVVIDMKGKTAMMNGKKLFRDRNDKFVAIYLREGKGVYSVHDAVTFPKGVSGFMVRLADPLDHATMFSFWGNKEMTQDCNDGVRRDQGRQGMPTGQQWVGASALGTLKAKIQNLSADEAIKVLDPMANVAGPKRVAGVDGQNKTVTVPPGATLVWWGTPTHIGGSACSILKAGSGFNINVCTGTVTITGGGNGFITP